MAKDAVNKITAAEANAAEIIARAKDEAKKRIADAEKEGKEALLKAEADAEAAVKKLLGEAEVGAESASRNIFDSVAQECDKLEALAVGRMDKAATVIAERVVKG